MDALFITGTDTGVGKTIVSLLLMRFLYKNGYTPFYLKPFQTGCRDPRDEESDARFIYRHVPHLKGKDPADSVIFCHKNPKAPFFAARDQGETIDINPVRDAIQKKSNSHSPLIIEGAGGVLVPVNDRYLMADIIKMVNARPVIVGRSGLGTINHTLLTVAALKERKIIPAGIILVDSGEAPTPQKMISENIEAIQTFSGIAVAGVIGKIDDFSNPGEGCYHVVERMVSISVSGVGQLFV